MTEQQRGRNTETLLNKIVTRLSGRDDLKGCNYKIKINSKNKIVMEPLVYVYPSIHKRQAQDKTDIVSFVMSTYMTERGTRSFVPGEYLYKSSDSGKLRRWERIK